MPPLTGLKSDSGTLDLIEDRIHMINSLKRKYGDSVSDILRRRDEIAKEFNNIENFEDRN